MKKTPSETLKKSPTIRNFDDSSSDYELRLIHNVLTPINVEDNQESEVDERNSDLGLSLENMTIIDTNREAHISDIISDSRSPNHLQDSPDAMKIDEKDASQSSSLSISTSVRNQERPNKVVKDTTRIGGEKRGNDSLDDSLDDLLGGSEEMNIDAEVATSKSSSSDRPAPTIEVRNSEERDQKKARTLAESTDLPSTGKINR
jgi:hypothetical protein